MVIFVISFTPRGHFAKLWSDSLPQTGAEGVWVTGLVACFSQPGAVDYSVVSGLFTAVFSPTGLEG